MDAIDSILCDWYTFGRGWSPVAGYEREDPSCALYRSSRQWMDFSEFNDEVDWLRIERNARAVDPLVLQLETRLRIAVSVAVKNFHAGAIVFTNPRHPQTQDADYAEAKRLLAPKLITAGVLERQAPQTARHVPRLA
ncbi:hypothetical protein [Burkholderia sp. SRS-W-2-2016]|uniref:hypothetical protein n=1 Tax=Burkholderia sp. SRS-W-2-2016 TaxID=1926878 RepID=UPI0009FB5F10|nr:hypothetical protein [Burkholderia sp. SRS-W-2-2016]